MRVITLILWSIVLGALFACLFGILFDQFSVRNSPIYFEIGNHARHPTWLPDATQAPTMVALYWGIVATWWLGAGFGAIYGVWLVLVDRRIHLLGLISRYAYLVLFMGVVGVLGFALVNQVSASLGLHPQSFLAQSLLNQLTAEQYGGFFENTLVHLLVYGASGVAVVFLMGYALAHGRNSHRVFS